MRSRSCADHRAAAAAPAGWRSFWCRAVVLATAAALTVGGCATAVDPLADARIEAEVKARLVAEKNANLTRLGVATKQATVYLNGAVESPEEKALAEGVARNVPGVKRVVNELTVR